MKEGNRRTENQDLQVANFAAECLHTLTYPKLKTVVPVNTPLYITGFIQLYTALFSLSDNPQIISFGIQIVVIIVISTPSQNIKGKFRNFMRIISDASYNIHYNYFTHLLNDIVAKNGKNKDIAVAMPVLLIAIFYY